jgi:hypothetical protein
MNLPQVITDLIKAQDNFDASAYADCFSETAIVLDEGNTYQGRNAIEKWIEDANRQYRTKMKPIAYTENLLKAEISGTFPGSPVVLSYHLVLENGLIQSLEIKE